MTVDDERVESSKRRRVDHGPNENMLQPPPVDPAAPTWIPPPPVEPYPVPISQPSSYGPIRSGIPAGEGEQQQFSEPAADGDLPPRSVSPRRTTSGPYVGAPRPRTPPPRSPRADGIPRASPTSVPTSVPLASPSPPSFDAQHVLPAPRAMATEFFDLADDDEPQGGSSAVEAQQPAEVETQPVEDWNTRNFIPPDDDAGDSDQTPQGPLPSPVPPEGPVAVPDVVEQAAADDFASGLRPPGTPEQLTPPDSPVGPVPRAGSSQMTARQRRSLDDLPLGFRAPTTPSAQKRSPNTAQLPMPQHKGPRPDPNKEVLVLHRDTDGYSLVKMREALLTGGSRMKEVRFNSLPAHHKKLFQESMAAEWRKWTEFSATRKLTEAELRMLGLNQHVAPGSRPKRVVGTRWVHTWKLGPGGVWVAKSRLVVQGCQESSLEIRSDAPTGSRNSFMLTLTAACQAGWEIDGYDAQTAFLQPEGIERCLILRLPSGDQAPPGMDKHGHLVRACGSIYGTKDAGRAFYLHVRKTLRTLQFRESTMEPGVYYLRDKLGTCMVIHTHVDDFLVARRSKTPLNESVLKKLSGLLHLKRTEDLTDFIHCGKRIRVTPEAIHISQERSASSVDEVFVSQPRSRKPDDLLTKVEHSSYRTALGQLQWLTNQARPDLATETNLCAQKSAKPTVQDARNLNALGQRARSTSSNSITLRRGLVDLRNCDVMAFGDSSLANDVAAEKSMFGFLVCLAAPGAHEHVDHVDRLDSQTSCEVNIVCRSLRHHREPRGV